MNERAPEQLKPNAPRRSSLVVAAVQPPCSGDLYESARIHAAAICYAHAHLVVFPELSLTGYELDTTALTTDDVAFQPIQQACAAAGSIALVGAPVLGSAGIRSIATVRVTPRGVDVVYRKMSLGGAEPDRFSPGDEPAILLLDGWRVGLGICKDVHTDGHIRATVSLGIDAYIAGVVHRPEDLDRQQARGAAIARAHHIAVVFASCAAATGWGFDRTAGHSTIWSPDGAVLDEAGVETSDSAKATLTLS